MCDLIDYLDKKIDFYNEAEQKLQDMIDRMEKSIERDKEDNNNQ